MSDLPNVPMSLLSQKNSKADVRFVIGNNSVSVPQPATSNSYWIVVVDRSTLAVEFSQFWTDPSAVPPIPSNLKDPQYMLVVISWGLQTVNVPSGPFYDFLAASGADVGLRTIVQMSNQVGSGFFSHVNYILVGHLGMDEPAVSGIEAIAISGSDVYLALELVPVDISGKVIYSPSRL